MELSRRDFIKKTTSALVLTLASQSISYANTNIEDTINQLKKIKDLEYKKAIINSQIIINSDKYLSSSDELKTDFRNYIFLTNQEISKQKKEFYDKNHHINFGTIDNPTDENLLYPRFLNFGFVYNEWKNSIMIDNILKLTKKNHRKIQFVNNAVKELAHLQSIYLGKIIEIDNKTNSDFVEYNIPSVNYNIIISESKNNRFNGIEYFTDYLNSPILSWRLKDNVYSNRTAIRKDISIIMNKWQTNYYNLDNFPKLSKKTEKLEYLISKPWLLKSSHTINNNDNNNTTKVDENLFLMYGIEEYENIILYHHEPMHIALPNRTRKDRINSELGAMLAETKTNSLLPYLFAIKLSNTEDPLYKTASNQFLDLFKNNGLSIDALCDNKIKKNEMNKIKKNVYRKFF
ncbi:hypothetical protein HN415_08505 [Candidatus Woesearchaeota archaeon]|jgi:hypothetical protein|nr:hypothetical protein [Candidatus Woesearchaeota archaeon]